MLVTSFVGANACGSIAGRSSLNGLKYFVPMGRAFAFGASRVGSQEVPLSLPET